MDSPTEQSDLQTLNVAEHLRAMARTRPYQRAVVYPAGRERHGRVTYAHYTFEQLERESDCLAHGLQAAGICQGSRTILMVKPSLEFFALTFALFKTGAVPVVVDPGMGLLRMLQCQKQSRPEAFIGISPAHLLRVFCPRYFRTLKTWVTVGRRWFWGGAGLSQLRRLPWKPFEIAPTRSDETAAILFTTGSTGPAKGVVYTHAVFNAQIRRIGQYFKISPGEIDLPTFPLFALFDPALGMTAVIPDMDPTKPARANPRKIIEAVVDQGVTNVFASPALLNRVGRFGQRHGVKLPSLKRVVSAGAPVAADSIERFAGMLTGDACIHTPYGATEAMPVSCIDSLEILTQTRHLSDQGYGICIGRPVEGSEVRVIAISDDPIEEWSDDLVLQDGEVGEIVVRGAQVTPAYFERPRADALAKIKMGDSFWHRMGDLGWLDTQGRIWFCGRKSHRVLTALGPFYTIPCEGIFNQHPQVFRSALVGIGPRQQQMPVICIEPEHKNNGIDQVKLKEELLALARSSPITEEIDTILFHDAFPVDIRHNSKIFREKLAVWAHRQISRNRS